MTFLLFLKVFHAAIFYNQNKNFMQIAARRRQVKCGSVDLKMILLYVLRCCLVSFMTPEAFHLEFPMCLFTKRQTELLNKLGFHDEVLMSP